MHQAYSSGLSIATVAKKTKPRTFVRGSRTYLNGISDLLLATLLLTRFLATLLLLATLTWLRLTTLLLLATLLATLLLTRLLVWILIHSFSSQTLLRHFDRSLSMARVNPRPVHSFHDAY
jgi:hypothetical protein